MTELEPHYECPVCLGIKLKKLELRAGLLLDYCSRCGGMWFDYQEVHALRQCRPKVLWERVTALDRPHLMRCHLCQASMDANAASCLACGWANQINCPVCERPLIHYKDLQLDVCKSCKGVWFDNVDLARIWNGQLDKCARRELARHQGSSSAPSDGVPLFLDVLCMDPFGAYLAADLAVEAGGAAVHVVADAAANAPEIAGAVIEGGAELAGSVFEAIAEIIVAIFG